MKKAVRKRDATPDGGTSDRRVYATLIIKVEIRGSVDNAGVINDKAEFRDMETEIRGAMEDLRDRLRSPDSKCDVVIEITGK